MSEQRKHGTAKSESNEIKRDGAKAQPNSGRGKVNKGDAILDGYWLVDYKEYEKSFSLTPAVWAKLCTDAIRSGNLEPALKVIFGTVGEQRLRLFVISEQEMNHYRALRSAAESSTMENE